MIELIVLAAVGLGTGAAWFYRKHKNKPQTASDIELFRDAIKLLAQGYLKRGETRAVDFAMQQLSTERVQQIARMLGTKRGDHAAAIRAVRVWLRVQLERMVKKVEG